MVLKHTKAHVTCIKCCKTFIMHSRNQAIDAPSRIHTCVQIIEQDQLGMLDGETWPLPGFASLSSRSTRP